jgi:hypothetical protein
MEIPHLSSGTRAVGYLPFLQLRNILPIQAPTLVLSIQPHVTAAAPLGFTKGETCRGRRWIKIGVGYSYLLAGPKAQA